MPEALSGEGMAGTGFQLFFNGLGVGRARRLKALEKENRRLRKAVFDPTLGNPILLAVNRLGGQLSRSPAI
ncbi:hypothetical protein CW354_10750 [Marinicaulis flavus]|uniref:Uncharacterized protein n=1 Tax=Hyphococcus luteus TaxID=2058213 RepID=A0A2S7K8C7_9PROT|nr:hypothetical protein CW354_10750 [Marinicaulis flavus]